MTIDLCDPGQIPAAVLNAYGECGFDTKSVASELQDFWDNGGEPGRGLWHLLNEHALNWHEPLGYESWLPALSQFLRQVPELTQRMAYHARLVALMAPLLPLPDILRMRDLREQDWAIPSKSPTDLIDDMRQPYTRDPEERDDPAFPPPEILQAERLQQEVQLFIETHLQDYEYGQDVLQDFLAFKERREAMDAYDLHRWLRCLSVMVVDQWIEQGLYNRYLWWNSFLDLPLPMQYVRNMLGAGVRNLVTHHSNRFIPKLADDHKTLTAFFATCSDAAMKSLLDKDDTPFRCDNKLWLQLAAQTLPRGMLPHPISSSYPRPSYQNVYKELWPLFQNIDNWNIATELGWQMMRATISPANQAKLIRHLSSLSHRRPAYVSLYHWERLLQPVQDGAIVCELLEIDDAVLRQALLDQYRKQKHKNWQPLYAFAERYPHMIIQARPDHIDIPLWRIIWQSNLEPCREWVADIVCDKLDDCKKGNANGPELAAFFVELAEDDASLLIKHLNDQYVGRYWGFRPSSIALLWEQHLSAIDPMLLSLFTDLEHTQQKHEAKALAREIITAQPDYLLNLKPTGVANLLPALDQALLEKVSPQLLQMISKSAAQSFRDKLVTSFAAFEPDFLVQLGWLDKKNKNVRQACLDILIQHPDRGALPHLRTLHQASDLDQPSKDRILSHLEANGENIDDLDQQAGMSLADLAEQAAKLKKVSKAVEAIYNDELAGCLPDVQPVLVRWLLHQLATDKGEGVPRSVVRMMQQCPLHQRQRFVAATVEKWLVHDGDPKLRWLLRLIPCGADDRLVPLLMDTVKAWHKKKKQRAVHAIHALGSVDTVFALSQVKIISENNKYTDTLTEAAHNVLCEAAERRQQTLPDLLDELVPDFGLGGDGLELDVGPYSYRLEMQGDLSLRVVSPGGKSLKSFPKAKAGEDAAKHADADAAFKRLRTAIKTVSKQQTKRLQTALFSARSWPVTRWQYLFVEHPLLRYIAQSLIWSRRAKDGSYVGTFRLSEDLSLIDHQDDSVELQTSDLISLWHPIETDDETMESWRQHLADYNLIGLIEQVNRPQLTLKPEWLNNATIIAYQGYVLAQGRFATKMNQWGYRQGPVEDGPNINEHYLTVPESHLMIHLNHSGMLPWMEPEHKIALENVTIHPLGAKGREHYGIKAHEALDPQKLPAVIICMLLAQLQELAQLGEGYRKDWHKM